MQTINLQYAPIGVSPTIHVSQYDVGRQFKLNIFDGDTAYSMPSGTTARIDGIKPDGHGFSYTDAVSVSGNVVTVTTKQQMTVLEGSVKCEIRFIKGANTIGTLNFNLLVEASPINEDTDISDTDIPAIIDAANHNRLEAEAWASGTKDGVPVTSEDEQYHNNAYYYADAAHTSEENAATSETNAGLSEQAAAQSEENAEAWAVGERNGTAVSSGDVTYHNNSKYYAQEAESSNQEAQTAEENAESYEQLAKDHADAAKASEDILQFYVDFVIPHFVIANNRLYVSDDAVGEFIVANNRLYIKNAS